MFSKVVCKRSLLSEIFSGHFDPVLRPDGTRVPKKEKPCRISARSIKLISVLYIDIYEDFCRKADSFTQYERTIVGGYYRDLSDKAGAER